MFHDSRKKATLKGAGKDIDFKQYLLDSFRGPNGEKPIDVKFELVEEGGTGIIIDRFKLGMRILNNAIDYGAELLDSTVVRKPIIDH